MRNREQWRPSKFGYSGTKLKVGKGTRFSSRLMIALIARNYNELLPKYARGKLLDLGCGQVPFYQAYESLVEDVHCIDWGGSLHETIHLDKEMDLNKPLDIADESYDTVILSDVLEHIAEPQQLMSEIQRVLKVGGTLIMNVPFYYFLHERPYDYFRYTEFALSHLAVKAGMEVIELKATAGVLEVMSDVFSKAVYPIPVVGKWIAYICFTFSWIFNKTYIGQKISNKSSKMFPFGYVMVAQKPTI